MRLASIALVVAAGQTSARAATINVEPGDGTIQAAVDQAQDGGAIVLAELTSALQTLRDPWSRHLQRFTKGVVSRLRHSSIRCSHRPA